MRFTKKFLALLFALLLALCAVSCGERPGQNDPGTPPGDTTAELPERDRLPLRGYEELELETEELNEAYIDSPFYSDLDDALTYTANALWERFGTGGDGSKVLSPVYGLNSSWLYWDCAKTMWTSDPNANRSGVKNIVRDWAITDEGYPWSWGDSETWGGKDYNTGDPTYERVYHYDTCFNFVNAVYEIMAWENSDAFLSEVDQDRRDEAGMYSDVSLGMTVREKLEAILDYILEDLNGKNGLIIIDNGLNTGELGSASSNYWDNLCFGYKDPYEGALFLGALQSAAGIYRMAGEEDTAAEYEALFDTAKEMYQETYFDAEKGRYVSTISESGRVHDYGLTFLNTEALFYGAGDAETAEQIFSWIDGRRIVEGDTVTGLDILDTWNFAPMANTVAIESIKETVEGERRPVTWWHGPSGINVFSSAKFKEHCENGGAIFYTAYFELMARLKYGMTDSAVQRMLAIVEEYEYDGLIRDPGGSLGDPWVLGVIGEFPESGLVPVAYLKGFMGVNATYRGLEIDPNIPEEFGMMGCDRVLYAGQTLDICIEKGNSVKIVCTASEPVTLPLVFSDFKGVDSYTVQITSGGETQTVTPVRGSDGFYAAEVTFSGASEIVIA